MNSIMLFLILLLSQGAFAADKAPSAERLAELRAALEHLQQGRAEVAEPLLQRLWQSYPNEPDFNQALGMLYRLKGEAARATPYLEKAVRLRPSAQAYIHLAANYADRGRDGEAVATFRKALALAPANIAARFHLAALYLKLGRPEQTRRTLLALPPKARDQEEIQVLLGSAALSLNQRSEAEAHFERALGLNPDSVQAAANLGALLVASGSTGRGLEMLESAWKKDPDSYLAGYNLALAYKQASKLEAARSVLTALLTKQETGELYNLMGELEASQQNYEGALHHLERAVELEASEAHLFDLGYRLLQLWTLDRAVTVFRRGTEQFPQSARHWIGLGAAYFAQARNEEAINAYLRATESGEDPRAYRFLGMAYEAINIPRADVGARFRRYRLARPQDAWANFYHGYCLSRGGPPERALPLLRRALELDPKLAQAHFELGLVYSRQGQPEKAIAAFQAAVQANPQYQQAYYRLGQAYARAGRQAEADAALARHEELRQQQAAENDARLRQAISSLW